MSEKKHRFTDKNPATEANASQTDSSDQAQKKTGKKNPEQAKSKEQDATPDNRSESPALVNEKQFPVVAIGASAGGVRALEELFSHLPTDTGMAFVVIIHLSSAHESNLPQLLAKHTEMPVHSAEKAKNLAPNQVFVIPADRSLTIEDRTLKVSKRDQSPGKFKPIDRFFETLAEQLQEKAIGVILSGTGSDGTPGIRAIKAAGGITFAQDEGSAQFAEMPLNAVQSGQIDLILDPANIARKLGDLVHHPYLEKPLEAIEEEVLSGWNKIQRLLKKNGIDFSQYKQSTVRRRIARRMAIHKIEGLEEYAVFLKEHEREIKALREDLLIKVTQFFRDPETFKAIENRVFPKIMEAKGNGDPVRIWVPGCATGEEAYSLAMALIMFLGKKYMYHTVQIFGTDVSEDAIEKARKGFYLESQISGLDEARLYKFFTPADGGYQVKKHLREACVFARQDFISDPPFSHLDLISCRNVLIYFSSVLQKKVFPIFHYALNPGGFLVLGSSENIGQSDNLFSSIDKKNRIYARKKAPQRAAVEYWPGRQGKRPESGMEPQPQRWNSDEKSLHREVDKFLLQKLDPAAVLVDDDWNVVEFRGDTTSFIKHHPGKASLNLLKMANDMLRIDLHALLQKAKKTGIAQKKENPHFDDDRTRPFALEVSPLQYDHERFFLVQFLPVSVQLDSAEVGEPREEMTESDLMRENRRLKEELTNIQNYAQQIVEEKDEALEDLKAANVEILSSNEELQSINEEIETAKEELESSNEELTTVNQELQNRNEELARTHNDLNNLILSVQIPFLIVSNDLKIRKISQNAEEMLQITPDDVGRSVADLKLSFEFHDFEKTMLEVIRSEQEVEREIQDRKGRWNLVRIRPYRNEKNGEIQGAVLALFDIDQIKRSLEEVEKAYKYSLQIVDTIKDPLLVLDEGLRVKKANPAFYQKFHVSPKQTEGQKLYTLGSGQWDHPDLRRLLEEILPLSNQMDNFLVEFEFAHLGPRTMMLSARKMQANNFSSGTILLAIRDVTEEKQIEGYLRQAKQDAEEASRAKSEFLATISHEIRTPITVTLSAVQYLRDTELEPEQRRCVEMAENSTISLLELLEDILDFSKIEVDMIKIESLPFELRKNMENAVSILRNEAVRKGLQFDLHIADEIPLTVVGDCKRLRQVLVNLAGNAIKFTESGKVSIRVELSPEPQAKGTVGLLFSLSDTGIGIPAEDLDRLFHRFTQLDSSITRKYGGTGLGLAICRGLVERMGGSIWVESRKGEGSTFYFTLPFNELPTVEESAKDPLERPKWKAGVREQTSGKS